MILEAKKLFVKHRHGALAINNLTFSIEKGQILTVLGESECGKTSLLKAIAGLYPLSGGELFLDGKNVADLSQSDRNVRLLHEDGGFFVYRSAEFNLYYPMRIRKEDFTFDALSFFPPDRLKTKVKKLRQEDKIALCFERLRLPVGKIFLLDDPFKNLSPDKRKAAFDLYLPFIVSLAERGAVIYATTDFSEAKTLDAPTLLLHYGNLQQYGKVSEFADKPNSLCALWHSDAGYTSGLTVFSEENGALYATIEDKRVPLKKENLLNEIYIGKEVIYAKTKSNLFFFDKNCEQRIYFSTEE